MGTKTYAITGSEGVGRTTSVIHLGAALERAGYNTAVVDADLELSNLAELLDITPDAVVQDVLNREASVNDVVVDGPDGVTILPGAPPLSPNRTVEDPWRKCNRVVEPLTAVHDIILIDAPTSYREFHEESPLEIDGTIFVTTPDSAAIGATEELVAQASELDVPLLGFVCTQVTETTGLAHIVDRLKLPAVATVPNSKILGEAPAYMEVGGMIQSSYESIADFLGKQYEGETLKPGDVRLTQTEAKEATTSSNPEEEYSIDDPASESVFDSKQLGSSFEAATGQPAEGIAGDTGTDETSSGSTDTSHNEVSETPAGSNPSPDEAKQSAAGESTEVTQSSPSEETTEDSKTLDDIYSDPEESDSEGALSRSLTNLRRKLASVSFNTGSSDDSEPVNPLDELRNDNE